MSVEIPKTEISKKEEDVHIEKRKQFLKELAKMQREYNSICVMEGKENELFDENPDRNVFLMSELFEKSDTYRKHLMDEKRSAYVKMILDDLVKSEPDEPQLYVRYDEAQEHTPDDINLEFALREKHIKKVVKKYLDDNISKLVKKELDKINKKNARDMLGNKLG